MGNSAITLGALAYVSEGIALQSLISNQREFSEVADDLHEWVGDVQRILTEAITEAADGSIEFIGDVAEDITEWINDAAVDAEDISDGTYCFERHCPQNEQ